MPLGPTDSPASPDSKHGQLLPQSEPQAAEDAQNTSSIPISTEGGSNLAEQISQNQYEMFQRSQQQLQEIEDEVRKTQELVGNKEDISELIASYDPDTAPQFHGKAIDLSSTYSAIRRIRGDGNCFYRALLTAELERCVNDKEELQRFTALCKGWRARLIAFGFPELTTGDFCDAIEMLLDAINDGTKPLEFLFDDLNNESIANYYVAFVRLITSGHLRENEEEYTPFIEGLRTLDQYCKDEIEPMWKECDHVCVIGLVKAIGVPIRIEYMDRTQALDRGSWHHDFPEGEEPKLFFLYRPGHYDILYPKV